MLAVARAKESIKQDMQVDMEKVKSKMKEVSYWCWKQNYEFQRALVKCQNSILNQMYYLNSIKDIKGFHNLKFSAKNIWNSELFLSFQ